MALKGINLGGWLIAERWMTPELFKQVQAGDERAIRCELGPAGMKRLDQHRDTFITEADFRWIKRRGFDFVRLPVGYWLFESTDDFVAGEKYVNQAFLWATKHKLKIILDFHGLQGSQNGQDHSGQIGKVRLYRRRNRRGALQTVDYISQRYGHEPALLAIELINEPKVKWFIFRLVNYYVKAYGVARQNVAPHVKLVVSDAFQPVRLAQALAKRNLGDQLVLDIHLYQLFSQPDQDLTFEEHMNKINDEWLPLLQTISRRMPILIGEWSAVLPQKVMREAEADQRIMKYYTAQLRLYESQAWAHSYWSYSAPGSGAWSYRGYFK